MRMPKRLVVEKAKVRPFVPDLGGSMSGPLKPFRDFSKCGYGTTFTPSDGRLAAGTLASPALVATLAPVSLLGEDRTHRLGGMSCTRAQGKQDAYTLCCTRRSEAAPRSLLCPDGKYNAVSYQSRAVVSVPLST